MYIDLLWKQSTSVIHEKKIHTIITVIIKSLCSLTTILGNQRYSPSTYNYFLLSLHSPNWHICQNQINASSWMLYCVCVCVQLFNHSSIHSVIHENRQLIAYCELNIVINILAWKANNAITLIYTAFCFPLWILKHI